MMKKEETELKTSKNAKKELETGKKKNVPAKKIEKDDGLEMLSVKDIDNIEKKTKKKKSFLFSAKIRAVITVLAVIVFLCSAWQLYSIFSEYKQGKDEYEAVERNFTTVDIDHRIEEEEGEYYYD